MHYIGLPVSTLSEVYKLIFPPALERAATIHVLIEAATCEVPTTEQVQGGVIRAIRTLVEVTCYVCEVHAHVSYIADCRAFHWLELPIEGQYGPKYPLV